LYVFTLYLIYAAFKIILSNYFYYCCPLKKHGNIDVARDCWSRALELDPLNAYVCHALSNLEKRLRNFDRAREVLTNVVNRRPTAALCVSLAELERALGRPEEARGVLLSGIENCQTEKSTLLLSLAWLEEDAFDKPDEAAAMIDEALHLDSKNIRVYIAKASILLRQQKVSEARAVLQACAGLKSDDGQHYTMWSTLELEDGNPSEARTILQEGARLYPGDQFLLQRWGTLESRLGNIEKARELFAKSVLIQPHAPTFVAWAILEEGEGIKVTQLLLFIILLCLY
jgi:tetratricopeptide (TPR) repeat protein